MEKAKIISMEDTSSNEATERLIRLSKAISESRPKSYSKSLSECFVDCCQKPKKVEYQCYFISFLPFFYISDCIRCGFCVHG